MKLSKMLMTKPLNEADSTSKYGLSINTTNSINYQNPEIDQAFNDIPQEPTQQNIPQDIPTNTTTDVPDAATMDVVPTDTEVPTDTSPVEEPAPNEDDPTSVADDTQVAGGTDNPQDVQAPEDPNAAQADATGIDDGVPDAAAMETDPYADADMSQQGDMAVDDFNTTEDDTNMKELRGLSDKQYKLCNTNLKDNFINLQNKAADIIKTDIPSIITSNPRLQQCIDIVHTNLDSFINDIQDFILFNYSSVYESNLDVYMKFAKRLRIAILALGKVKKENAKYKDQNT